MNLSLIDLLAAGTAVLAVGMCGIAGMPALLRSLAAQSALLAAIAIMLGVRLHTEHYLWIGAAVFIVKAVVIPLYLARAARQLKIRHDEGALLSPPLALLAGCGIVVAAYFLAPGIAVAVMGNAGAAGMALALLLIGMLVMLTRRLALSQVIGFLMLENGIFLYGLTQTHGMPLLVEMGVIFDVLVCVLVAGLVIFRLNRSFEHIDVTQLRGLRH